MGTNRIIASSCKYWPHIPFIATIQTNRVLTDEAGIRADSNLANRNVGADMNLGIKLRYAGVGIWRRDIATLGELISFKISVKHDPRVGVIFLGSERASDNPEYAICCPNLSNLQPQKQLVRRRQW